MDIEKVCYQQKFENFVSLGTNCATAFSMSKYGLRSWARVFDWLITEKLEWVLRYMENDFKDFLEEENLETYDTNPF